MRRRDFTALLSSAAMWSLAANAQQTSATARIRVKVSTARLLATVLREIGAQFERDTGHELIVTEVYGPEMIKRLNAGEPFDADVLILRSDYVDAFIKDGRLLAETRTDLVRTGIGVEVRSGALKPDIGSVEAFKRAMLNAKSIAYLKNGIESDYLDGLFQRLGIAAAVGSKLTRPESDIVSTLTAKGNVELGIAITTQIVTTPGVELVGPLPPQLQRYYAFSGAVSAASKVPAAAVALIRFLKEPAAIRVIRAQAMEPG